MTDLRQVAALSRTNTRGVRLLAVFAWIWLLVAIPFLTDAASPFPIGCGLALSWFALAVAWWTMPFVSAGGIFSKPWRQHWLLAGIAGALGLCLAFTNIGLIARLYLCDRQLAAYATSFAPGAREVDRDDPAIIGLFNVEETEEYQGAVYLYMGWGFLDRGGLVYFPGIGAPPNPGRISTHHLYGPWHRFRWRF
jgi:hypothetical protein